VLQNTRTRRGALWGLPTDPRVARRAIRRGSGTRHRKQLLMLAATWYRSAGGETMWAWTGYVPGVAASVRLGALCASSGRVAQGLHSCYGRICWKAQMRPT